MDPITKYLMKCGIGWGEEKEEEMAIEVEEMMKNGEFAALIDKAMLNREKRMELGKIILQNLFFLKGKAFVSDKRNFVQRFGLQKQFLKIPDEMFQTIEFSTRGTQNMLCAQVDEEKVRSIINNNMDKNVLEGFESTYAIKKVVSRKGAYQVFKKNALETVCRLELDIQIAMIVKSEQLNKEIGTLFAHHYGKNAQK